ncbi:hypothetical protein BRADI_2g57800v3 [Brachypodium distachyon]|uniref:BHLH domain-containing protein n=1 Tax=Brachypodium distachyon TaxID=15368 RepID=A0A2K2DGJ6_BRADI|nr:hypothetical protein BRADI_2g57800v3 [Brachypodium distachyon]
MGQTETTPARVPCACRCTVVQVPEEAGDALTQPLSRTRTPYSKQSRKRAMNRLTPAHHGRAATMHPPQHHHGGLARYGSAPGAFLAALADSVVASPPPPPVVSRFFSGGGETSSGLASCESSCHTDGRLQRAYGGSGEIIHHVPQPPPHPAPQSGLLRHSSSPAGLLSRLMADPHGNNGGMGNIGGYTHSQAAGNVDAMAQHRRLSSQWSFSRQQQDMIMPQISEMGMALATMPADIGESIATGGNSSSDGAGGNAQSSSYGGGGLSRNFSMSSWDDTNSIMFSSPARSSKKAKVMVDLDHADDGMVTSFSNIDSQFGVSSSSLEMPGMDDYLQLQQDSVACRVRAKRGCATHPRSIAERERRTRISKRLRKLQDLVPNMDKVA